MGKVVSRKTAAAKGKRSAVARSTFQSGKRKTQGEGALRYVAAVRKRNNRLLENPFKINGTKITVSYSLISSIPHYSVSRINMLKRWLKQLVNPFGVNGIPVERQDHLFFEFENNRNELMQQLMTKQERQEYDKAQANLAAKMSY